jgi:hypothetical protein
MTTFPSPPPSPRRSPLVRQRPLRERPLGAIEQGAAILCRLDAMGYLTNDQIETLHFARGQTVLGHARAPKGAPYAANTALRRLFDAGYLDRIPVFLPGRRPQTVKAHYVNILAPRGVAAAAAVIRERGGVPRHRRGSAPRPWQPLVHGDWIREVAVIGETACQTIGWSWWNWFDDRQLAALKREQGARYRVVPDAFAMITNRASGRHYPHFFEIDLGTETVAARSPFRPDWRRKIASYLSYLRDDFREQFGVTTPPVILTVTTSDRRLEHLLAATAAAGGGGRFWFTTFARLMGSGGTGDAASDALEGGFWAPIWQVPGSTPWRSLAARCGAESASGGE